ncbi:neutral zinc metallopeptidase [Alienimonas sp. DA493]|uniref:KPN_02809 family neutral zinc metallopeptidase n=1 Tax=Alienimonas sp. DA493 TaxID=3373605 RepID=UPI00375520F0
MRWRGRRESTNVEDRRGVPAKGLALGGGGLGTLVIVALVWLLTGDPQQAMQAPQRLPQNGGAAANRPAGEDDDAKNFVEVVLASTEDAWDGEFKQHADRPYQKPTLVLFSQGQQVNTGCGIAGSSIGPFYCPADRNVYLSPSFFAQLRDQMNAPGDFAAAYVVAHEVGHHVQNLLGYSDRMNRYRGTPQENEMSVRLELQADFLAGVWAHHARQEKDFLEPGDVEEALNAASRIGDDVLQKQATGTVNPEGFTHGTSAQRVRWFRRGFETGDLSLIDEPFQLPYERL